MIRKFNGWQRIWFVMTCLGVLAAAITPYFWVYNFSPSEYEYKIALESDLRNQDCKTMATAPFTSLKEPAYGNCWHIYISRQYSETQKVPYTMDVYREDKSVYRFKQYLIGLGILEVLALICSALLYGVGFVLSWIIKGFRPAKIG